MQKYVLIGDSGHAKVLQDCIISSGGQIIAKLDDKYSTTEESNNVIIGPLSIIKDVLEDENTKVVIAIGNNSIRKKIVERLNLPINVYGIVKHESAIISEYAKIGNGTVIMPGAIINAGASIGEHVIINSNVTIEHDCRLEDYVHISPSATLTGNVNVSIGTQIGAGATIIPGKKIGSWSVVGAGSTVINDIESNLTVVGSPAK